MISSAKAPTNRSDEHPLTETGQRVLRVPNCTGHTVTIAPRMLHALREDLAARRTLAFLVVRNDRVVYEWYARGVTADTKQGTASLAKALVGGLSLGVAITDGRIGLDDPAAKFLSGWKDDPKKA